MSRESIHAQAPAQHATKTPGTHHSFTNRLIHEKSPYLLQHAYNPVDWYPWGSAAFEKARNDKKPIFLSIGYATCHWCHVMEEESFENPAVARILNEHFVCVKVDREERPDVDRVYMTFVQAQTGRGGWPMSVWLTPGRKPFHGGTYFPPSSFTNLLGKIAEAWKASPDRIEAVGESITSQLRTLTTIDAADRKAPDLAVLLGGYEQIKSTYEPRYGGFGSAPKFPRPVTLNFMLRFHDRTGTKDALEMCLFTLKEMAEGGMHDHLGGGFHRYSVDNRWHVPHFEKMLYDQAQLAISYLEAYQITRSPFHADIARDILDYVRRDMTGEQGQFYSAEDADSPIPGKPGSKAEGAFYVWEFDELKKHLGEESSAIFNHYYGVEKNGNVDSDPHNEFPNKNVLIVSQTQEAVAKKFGKTTDEIRRTLAEARQKLLKIRSQRPRPLLDDKTITAWNGLMISAFAQAYQVLGEEDYLTAGTKAARFIKDNLYDAKTKTLTRRYREGDANIDGFVDDYAFLIQGLIDLYQSSFNIDYLTWAIDLQEKQNALFWDKTNSGYFGTTGLDPTVLLRMKEDYDGAEPSPNSISTLNLLRLGQMLNQKTFLQMAEQALSAFGSNLHKRPSAMPQMLVALEFHQTKPKQIIIAGKPDAPDTKAMLKGVHQRFIPRKILLLADGGAGQAFLGKGLEVIRSVTPINNQATAYVCQDYVCQLPTRDVTKMLELIGTKPAASKPKEK